MSAVVAVAGPAGGNAHAWERGRLVRDGDGRHLGAGDQGHGRLQESEGPRDQSAWEEMGEDMVSGDHEGQKDAVEEEEAVWKRASVAKKAAAVPTTTTKT